MKKLFQLKCLNILSVALIALASVSVSAASMWIFEYQPKTPKTLLEKSR